MALVPSLKETILNFFRYTKYLTHRRLIVDKSLPQCMYLGNKAPIVSSTVIKWRFNDW